MMINKKIFYLFIFLCLIITLPLFIPALLGQIKNESGMVLILPFIFGLPWSVLLSGIPTGLIENNIPDASGNLFVSPLMVIFFMIPVYINLFLIFLIIQKITEKIYSKIKDIENSTN